MLGLIMLGMVMMSLIAMSLVSSVIRLSVFMLNAVMLTVAILSVVKLSFLCLVKMASKLYVYSGLSLAKFTFADHEKVEVSSKDSPSVKIIKPFFFVTDI
jgi:hypothetical protein